MALQLTITNPENGATYANAYGRVDSFLLEPGITRIALNWYASSDAATSNLDPVRNDPTSIPTVVVTASNPTFVQGLQNALNANAIASPQDALTTAMYLILLELPRYAGATSV